jgi:hypothetical protein
MLYLEWRPLQLPNLVCVTSCVSPCPCRPVQALITRLCNEAAAAAEGQQQPLQQRGTQPSPGIAAVRGDVLLLARLLHISYTANAQVCL